MKFTPRSETTRSFIIEACAETFNKKGFAGTSITDLEKVTGLTKGSIYGNFENKDAVALAVLEYNLKQKRELIQQKIDQCSSFKDKLRTHLLVYYPEARIPFVAGGCPLLNTTVEADDTNDEFREKAAGGLLMWVEQMTDLIDKGIIAGEFKAETKSMETALHLISLIEGAGMFGKATQNAKYAKLLLDTGLKVIDGICT